MRKFALVWVALLSANTLAAAENAIAWKYDHGGATRILFSDESCSCYFDLTFPEKVTPQPRKHFMIDGVSVQIVTVPISKFVGASSEQVRSEEGMLRKHESYELAYLKNAAQQQGLQVAEATDLGGWDAKSKILVWTATISGKGPQSIIATSSTMSGECVVYLSAVLADAVKKIAHREANSNAFFSQTTSAIKPART